MYMYMYLLILTSSFCPIIIIITRNTWLEKPRKAGAGWKDLFTRIVASNEEIKRFLNIATILMSMVFS